MQGSKDHVDMDKKVSRKSSWYWGRSFFPLGLALLEQFASGVSIPCLLNSSLFFLWMFTKQDLSMRKMNVCHTSEAPSTQGLALAATKSGASRPDVQELAKLGNFGNSPQIYEQMVSKYCKSEALRGGHPIPVVVTKESSTAVQWRPVFVLATWMVWLDQQL